MPCEYGKFRSGEIRIETGRGGRSQAHNAASLRAPEILLRNKIICAAVLYIHGIINIQVPCAQVSSHHALQRDLAE